MRVDGFTTGVYQSNCYLIAAAGTDAVVVDPGQDAAEVLLERIRTSGLRVRAVLLTHGHLDHIWDAAEVADALGVPAYLHPDDLFMFDDPGAAIGAPGHAPAIDRPSDLRALADGDRFTFGGLSLETRHAPGHSRGHCAFLTDGLVVSGDLIFAGSVGRTDFPGGSFEDLLESIRRVVLPLDDETVIVSGHGSATTVGRERASNPFVVDAADQTLPRLLGL